ncbi:hypothetical protein AKO1_005987 [Acrasis kona]|uniref:Uncharacterized protein n=1 Tax=Acrasis kona TaxID=1008807 RepID=A0AAW2ZKJ8_9EUKA
MSCFVWLVVLVILSFVYAGDTSCQAVRSFQAQARALAVSVPTLSTWVMDVSQLGTTYNGYTGPHNNNQLSQQKTFVGKGGDEAITCQIDCASTFNIDSTTSVVFQGCQNRYYSYGSKKTDGCLSLQKSSSIQMGIALDVCKKINKCQQTKQFSGAVDFRLSQFKTAVGQNTIGEAFRNLDNWYAGKMDATNSYIASVEESIKSYNASSQAVLSSYIQSTRDTFVKSEASYDSAIKKMKQDASPDEDVKALEALKSQRLKAYSDSVEANIAAYIQMIADKTAQTRLDAQVYINKEKDKITSEYRQLELAIMMQSNQAKSVLKANWDAVMDKIDALKSKSAAIKSITNQKINKITMMANAFEKSSIDQVKDQAIRQSGDVNSSNDRIIQQGVVELKQSYEEMKSKLVEIVKSITTDANSSNKQINSALDEMTLQNIKIQRIMAITAGDTSKLLALTSQNQFSIKSMEYFKAFASVGQRVNNECIVAINKSKSDITKLFVDAEKKMLALRR